MLSGTVLDTRVTSGIRHRSFLPKKFKVLDGNGYDTNDDDNNSQHLLEGE